MAVSRARCPPPATVALSRWPVPPTLAALVHQALGTGVLLVAFVATSHGQSVVVPFVAVLVAFQVVFTKGLGWMLASLTVFFRHIGHFLGLAFTSGSLDAPLLIHRR